MLMIESYPWYAIASGPGLVQGDILYRCPVLVPASEIPEDSVADEYLLLGEVLTYDVIVMSQSCDLEQEKLDLVLVCPHWDIREFTAQNDYLKSKRGKEDLKRGNIPGYHLPQQMRVGRLGERSPRGGLPLCLQPAPRVSEKPGGEARRTTAGSCRLIVSICRRLLLASS